MSEILHEGHQPIRVRMQHAKRLLFARPEELQRECGHVRNTWKLWKTLGKICKDPKNSGLSQREVDKEHPTAQEKNI